MPKDQGLLQIRLVPQCAWHGVGVQLKHSELKGVWTPREETACFLASLSHQPSFLAPASHPDAKEWV